MPPLDESKAPSYIGKTILVGVTYLDSDEKLLSQKQWSGIIRTFSNTEGIKIEDRAGSIFCLPPDPSAISAAAPGSYRLRSTGETIEDPDFLATWTCIRPKNKNEK